MILIEFRENVQGQWIQNYRMTFNLILNEFAEMNLRLHIQKYFLNILLYSATLLLLLVKFTYYKKVYSEPKCRLFLK